MDRGQMEQVLLNVVKNRIGPTGAPVIEVEDTGPGFPEGVRENLFTPFFSTKDSSHRFAFALERLPEGVTRFAIVLADKEARVSAAA